MANTPIVLDYEVTTQEAARGISKLQKQISAKMKAVEKSTKALDKGIGKLWNQRKGAQEQVKAIAELTKEYEDLEAQLTQNEDALEDLQRRGKTASGDQLANIQAEIKTQQDLYAVTKKQKNESAKAVEKLKDSAGDLFDLKGLISGAEEAGRGFADSAQDGFRKDLPKIASKTSGLITGLVSKGLGGIGDRMSARGASMSAKGDALKEKNGGNSGKGLKMMGSVMSVLGSALKALGPLLQIASSFMMGFVQMLIDAEGAAKEYNKTLMASTSTGDFLASSFGDVEGATKALGAALKDARDGAKDWSMVQWGITKEVAVGFQAAMGAQGISLQRMGQELKKATGYAQSHAKVIQMGVAYSRSFGVSLDEITNIQGEMMADMGMGLDQVEASFALVKSGAEDAGMATNKFFGIIRSFSADMNLFAMRMADVTKIMAAMAKTMDPRDAQKFMQTLSQKFSGGMLDNLRNVAIGGASTKKVVKRDLAEKKSNLKEDLKSAFGKDPGGDKAIEDLLRIIEDPKHEPRKVAEWQAKHQAKLNGSLKGAILDTFDMQKISQQGAEGQAAVLDQLSPLNKLAVTMGQIKALTGKGLDSLNSTDLLQLESSNIASAQEVRSFKKLEASFMNRNEEIIYSISNPKKDAKGNVIFDPKNTAMLEKLGVATNASAEDQIKELRAIFEADKDFSDTIGMMSKDQQEALTASAATMTSQEQTAGFQTSALDKLGIIADVLMNQIYNVMSGIWDAVLSVLESIPGLGDGGRGRAVQKAGQVAIKDPALAKAIAMGGGDLTKAKTNAIEGPGKEALAGIQKAAEEYRDLQAKVGAEADPAKKKAMEDRMAALEPAVQYAGVSKGAMYDQGGSVEGAVAVIQQIADMREALNKAGIKPGAPAPGAPAPGAPAPGTPGAAAAPAAPAAAAGAPAAPAAAAGAPAAPAAAAAATVEPPTAELQATSDTSDGVEQLHKDMRSKGIKLDTGMVTGSYSKAMAEAVYQGSAKALFEYYMYSGIDQNVMATALKSGVSPQAIRQGVTSGEAPEAALAKLQSQALGQREQQAIDTASNAGKLHLPPAAPQPPASTPGTTTTSPATGGGGGTTRIELEMKGDLGKFINARVVDGVGNFERNKRTR